LILTAHNIPSPNANGIFFMGMSAFPPIPPASAAGNICTGGGLRFPAILDDNAPPNEMVLGPGIAGLSAFGGVPIQPGQTWHFQTWTRDNNGSPCPGTNSNVSNAYSVTFAP
jgi:hypothetical protein